MREFRQSDLAATIPDAYRVEGEPRLEIFEVVSILRAEARVAPSAGAT
jgi:hypothetical protein